MSAQVARPHRPTGPAINAIDLWVPGTPWRSARHQLLSAGERARLAKIASIVRYEKGEEIYRQGSPAVAAFNIISGVATTYWLTPRDRQHITAFLYPGDIFGLSEEGKYTNSAKAATPVSAYKFPLHALRRVLSENADLDVNIIVKLCQELRQAQQHAIILAKKHAVSRLAMFLSLHEQLQSVAGKPSSEIYLPMDRSAIAEYAGLSLAAVSRAFRALIGGGVIICRDRRHAKVIDRAALQRAADDTTRGIRGGRKLRA